MADLNEVRLIGRLTRDPEVRMTPNGSQLASFGLATGRKYAGQDGGTKEETTFVDITCWAKLAEVVSKYLRKGKLVFVAGRLKFDSWEDRQTGQKRTKLGVVAENIQFLDRREDREEQASPDIPGVPKPNPTSRQAGSPDYWSGQPEPEFDGPPF
jgi:single-strand DNA-binding protein